MSERIRWTATTDLESWKPMKQPTKAQLQKALVEVSRMLSDAHRDIAMAGGAKAFHHKHLLIITHPDMPAHVWDGEKMERLL